jgi:hypothetical protein
MATVDDDLRLLPPAARTELRRYPLTETESAEHADGPLGAAAGWWYCGAGCGPLALALHELTGLPLVGLIRALHAADARDLPLDVMLDAGVGRDAHVLCACGWRAGVEGRERLVCVGEDQVRALCDPSAGADPDDPPTAQAAREAARVLLERAGLAPG